VRTTAAPWLPPKQALARVILVKRSWGLKPEPFKPR
jgi:hypothetical protein